MNNRIKFNSKSIMEGLKLVYFHLNIHCVNAVEKINQYTDFETIKNSLKKILGNEFMLIEDLWFWGYF